MLSSVKITFHRQNDGCSMSRWWVILHIYNMTFFGPFNVFLMVFWRCNWVLVSDTEISNRNSSFTNKIRAFCLSSRPKIRNIAFFRKLTYFQRFFPHFPLLWWWNQFFNRKPSSSGDDSRSHCLGTNFSQIKSLCPNYFLAFLVFRWKHLDSSFIS